jgi:hypothetical protein
MRTVTSHTLCAAKRRALSFVALALAMLMLGVLSGCVSSPTRTQPASTAAPHFTPIFSTDNQALIAATDAYAVYLSMSDEILDQGGADPGRLQRVATGEALNQLEKQFSTYSKRQWHTSGNTMFDSMKVQARSALSVTVYVCDDVSNVAIVDASGTSLLRANDATRTPFVARFVQQGQQLLLASKIRWTGDDFCT